jgi:hypothetical protein
LIHDGRSLDLFWNGEEFFLIPSGFKVGQEMQPVLPLMASVSENFLDFAYRSTEVLQ